MIRTSTCLALFSAFGLLTVPPIAIAQSPDTPMSRLRPIGEISAVDRYRPPAETQSYRETAYQRETQVRQADGTYGSAVRQTVELQQFVAPQLPGELQNPGGFAPPPTTGALNLPPGPPLPAVSAPALSTPVQTTAPRSLPVNPGNLVPVPLDQSGRIPSSSDLAPLAQPQLNDGFATIDNCPCISPPSSYVAASSWGPCAPVSYQAPVTYQAPQAYIAPPPTQIVAPAFVPAVPLTPKQAGIPRGALVSFGQEANPVQVGQGIVGQPVAYVPGQRIRNWFRYFFP